MFNLMSSVIKEFCPVEASVTVKIKGVTKSQLHDRTKSNEGKVGLDVISRSQD